MTVGGAQSAPLIKFHLSPPPDLKDITHTYQAFTFHTVGHCSHKAVQAESISIADSTGVILTYLTKYTGFSSAGPKEFNTVTCSASWANAIC